MKQNLLEKVQLNRSEQLSLIAWVSHQTWMKQASRDKGIPIEKLSKEVSDGDKERAEDALNALEERKLKIKTEAINLLAKRSHDMWLNFRKEQGSPELVRIEPENHDYERAKDIINALQACGALSFNE